MNDVGSESEGMKMVGMLSRWLDESNNLLFAVFNNKERSY